jgi:hypothetical protein
MKMGGPDQFGGVLALDFDGIQAGQQILNHENQRLTGCIGKRIVMGDVRLGITCRNGRFFRSTVAGKGDRQHAHGCAVAGVILGCGSFWAAGLAELDQVSANRVADVDGFGAHPGVEGFGRSLGVDRTFGQD